MSEQPGKSEVTADLAGLIDTPPQPQQPATPAPAGEENHEDRLFAGKFKTVEELEQAFAEASKAPKEPAKVEGTPAQIPEGQDAAAADAIAAAGLDSNAMAEEFAKSGTLSEETRVALEKAGYSREVQDVYLDGLRARQSSYSTSVYGPAGGEAGYTALVQWATTNLNADQKRAFNEAVTSGDASRAALAVQGLVALRGGTARLLNGKTTGSDTGPKPFASTAQVVEAMRDPRYSRDPAYRKEVSDRLAVSSVFK